MAIAKELLDQLLAGRDPNEVFVRDVLLDDLEKALSNRILDTEPDERQPAQCSFEKDGAEPRRVCLRCAYTVPKASELFR